MVRVKLATLAQLPPGALLHAEYNGDPYVLCNVEGQIHALDGFCPHNGAPLGQGALHGSTIVCPWHAWEFDCHTGQCGLSEVIQIAKFPVTLSGEDVLVDVPGSGEPGR